MCQANKDCKVFWEISHGFFRMCIPESAAVSVVFVGDWRELSAQLTRNQEIGVGFVSCSRRACKRAGEVKLCGRVREKYVSTLGLRMVRCVSGRGCVLGVFAATCIRVLFLVIPIVAIRLVLFVFLYLWCYAHGSFIGLADRQPQVALCVFFWFWMILMPCARFFNWLSRQAPISCYMYGCLFLCFWCYVHGFFDWFSRQATISCYKCRFLCSLLFLVLYA